MTTTLCFAPSAELLADPTQRFVVQVVGVDPDGKGIWHKTFEDAMSYAKTANGNGFKCFVYLQ